MHKSALLCLVMAAVAVASSFAALTPAEQCQGHNFEGLKERVQVSPCGKKSCKLRKGSDAHITIKFKPNSEVKTLTNTVYATIAGLPLPFVGVDGTSACGQVFLEDGKTPAPCPLKAGEEYIYKNSFPVLSIYPSVSLRVHWALTNGNKEIYCFEIPASISG